MVSVVIRLSPSQTCLMLRTAFRMALRQSEGLLGSVITLMGLNLSAPDHTTVSRRAVTLPALPREVPAGPVEILIDSTGLQVFGAGQWLEQKHGAKSRRRWRKLHLAVAAGTGMIVAHTLTDQHADDPSQVGPLLDQIDGEIARVIADGAYDGAPTYQTVAQHGDGIAVVIPPRATAVTRCELGPPTQRECHLAAISENGRLGWQKATGYGRRAPVETTMGRYKAIIGPRLRARGFAHSRPRRPSAWRCSTACWTPHARNPCAVSEPPHNDVGERGAASCNHQVHQRRSDPHVLQTCLTRTVEPNGSSLYPVR
jgi:transposase